MKQLNGDMTIEMARAILEWDKAANPNRPRHELIAARERLRKLAERIRRVVT